MFLIFVLALAVGGLLGIHPFLAPTHPVTGGILVVEGWGPDYAMNAAAEEFARSPYQKIYVTGGPLEWGGPLSDYKSYAELGAAILGKSGLSSNVVAVPAPKVQRDRTYNSALALRKYLDEHGIPHSRVNLISVGVHSRRSRLLCQKAFGKGTRVGIIALTPMEYNPRRWWQSSQGFRAVMSETFAYAYVRVFFRL